MVDLKSEEPEHDKITFEHTSYLSHFLHNHNLSPENFTLERA